jgi:hypothetical protein
MSVMTAWEAQGFSLYYVVNDEHALFTVFDSRDYTSHGTASACRGKENGFQHSEDIGFFFW